MKKIVVILFTVIFALLISCKKDPETPTGGNKISFGATLSDTVSYIFAKVSTQLNGTKGNQISQHGHCWSTESSPDIEDSHNALGGINSPGKFISDLSGLSDNTKYFIRSYVTFQGGTIYGIQKEITTLKRGRPIANTGVATDLTSSSVKISGAATFDSGYAITQKGICWDTVTNPTIFKCVGHSEEGAGTGSFISSVANLIENKQYYYCAYATNEKGTAYGIQNEFTTLDIILPEVQTVSIIYSTDTSSVCSGNVISDGGGIVFVRGVCWSTSKDPTIANSHTTDGNGTGPFSSDMTGLNANTTYYVRAYATNSVGTSYGQLVAFKTPGPNTVIDIDGNIYHTLVIETQVWMVENLKTTKFRNGDPIPYWNNSTSRGYCWYNHDSLYKNTYGAIYNYYTSADSRSICPPGWHIPSVEDWTTLINYLGGESVAGGKLKEVGTMHWNSPNTGATNIVGFTALPGGARDCSNNFINMGSGCSFWTSLEVTGGWVKGIEIQYNSANISFGSGFDCNASYVRCIKNNR